MCGRYTIRRVDLLIRFGATDPPLFETFDEKRIVPRFNAAPSQSLPIVRVDKDGRRVVSMVSWGLIPSWAKEMPKVKPINAKSETAATSGMFRLALARRRCLIPADGFYEWKGTNPPKVPHFIHMADDRPFAFAGLWERWRADEETEPVDTFTMLTTTPNELMKSIHNRMPVILDERDYGRWLDRDRPAADVADLLKPFPAEEMDAYPVSTKVNKPANDTPDLIEPELPLDGARE